MSSSVLRRQALSMRSKGMRFDVDPQAPGNFFFSEGPFVFDQSHRLLDPLCAENPIAPDADQMQLGEASIPWICAIAPSNSLHIIVERHQDRLIRERRGADNLIWRGFRQDLSVKNHLMSVFGEHRTNRIGNACVQ